MPFADLLQWVTHSRKTGTLVVEGESYIKKIYFQDGLVAAVASNNPKEFLGYYLVGWDYIGDEELQELLDMQEQHRTMLGELLVMIGRLTREELDRVLRESDFIISKGMGNFECFTETDYRPLAYLMRTKCEPVADAAGAPIRSNVAIVVE